MRKLACLFGIKNFDPSYYGSGNDLKGCENDAMYMEKVAKSKGFETKLFLSKQATYKVYIDQLKEAADTLVAGDTFLFMVSCHGTYQDVNEGGVEKRRTALCLYDKIVWDFETKQLMMRFKKGVNVIWMSDCCHARDNFKSFFNVEMEAEAKFLDMSQINANFDLASKEVQLDLDGETSTEISCNIVAYSSSTEFQVSYDLKSYVDGRPMGLFTAAIENMMKTPSNAKLSYYQFYRRLLQEMAKLGYPQTPKIQTVNGHQEKISYKEFLT